MKPVTLAAVLLTALVSYTIYQLKYDVIALEDELAALNGELVDERQATRVLRAEWSYLNRPDRLQELAGRYLALAPSVVYRAAALTRLPAQAAPVEPLWAAAAPGEEAPPMTPPLPRAKPSLPPPDGAPRPVFASTRPTP